MLALAGGKALVIAVVAGLSGLAITANLDRQDTGLNFSRHEVTWQQWKTCYDAGGCSYLPKPGSKAEGSPEKRATRDGYTLLTWPGRDFTYSAVSDVAPNELEEFVARWRAGAAGN